MALLIEMAFSHETTLLDEIVFRIYEELEDFGKRIPKPLYVSPMEGNNPKRSYSISIRCGA